MTGGSGILKHNLQDNIRVVPVGPVAVFLPIGCFHVQLHATEERRFPNPGPGTGKIGAARFCMCSGKKDGIRFAFARGQIGAVERSKLPNELEQLFATPICNGQRKAHGGPVFSFFIATIKSKNHTCKSPGKKRAFACMGQIKSLQVPEPPGLPVSP